MCTGDVFALADSDDPLINSRWDFHKFASSLQGLSLPDTIQQAPDYDSFFGWKGGPHVASTAPFPAPANSNLPRASGRSRYMFADAPAQEGQSSQSSFQSAQQQNNLSFSQQQQHLFNDQSNSMGENRHGALAGWNHLGEVRAVY